MTLPIGAAIRYVRKTRGLSGAKLADKVGCTASYVSQVENGHKAPGLGTIVRFADAMELAPHKLVKLICKMGCHPELHDSAINVD